MDKVNLSQTNNHPDKKIKNIHPSPKPDNTNDVIYSQHIIKKIFDFYRYNDTKEFKELISSVP